MRGKRGKTVSEAEFRRLWADHSISRQEIGRRIGVNETAVWSRARVRNLPPRPHGGGSPQKICDRTITDMWAANVGVVDIARHFGVTHGAVRKYCRLRGWTRNCNHANKISLEEYLQIKLSRAMAAQAAATTEAMRDAEMMDGRIGQKRKSA